ncbi:MAG: sodium:proton antiporter [Oscillospiraceae bacterium]|nr:sodium:proton antiporter [Oscillospiraceae bacterium]
MAELVVLGLFAVSLFFCVAAGASVLFALVFGFALFFGYGIYRGHTPGAMCSMALSGIKTAKDILLLFLLIGMMTALWRSCGTIPYIIYYGTALCSPHFMLLASFLLCCLTSVLTGTSFGTAATIGVICVTMANSMGIPLLYSGGAVLAGSYFGDRCSPMSTSALLVSSLTGTDIFRNVAMMVKTAAVPWLASCALYLLLGLHGHAEGGLSSARTLFAQHFSLHPAALIPAGVILLFSLLRIKVRIAMCVSILCSAAAAVLLQGAAPLELLRTAVFGYAPGDPQLAALLSGGGVASMKNVFCIVGLSSCYAGMFNGTGLLDGLRRFFLRVSRRFTPYGGVLLSSILVGAVACNQTLTIMLAHQLCADAEPDGTRMAEYLENSAVTVAPLFPWSIAAAVPLASVGAPSLCIATAFFLYLLPLWSLIRALRGRRRAQAA